MSNNILKHMLLNDGLVKVKKQDEELFTLKCGKKSKVFFDVKEASLNPIILREIVVQISKKLENMDLCYDIIGSVAIGGVAIASVFSYITYIPQIIVRSHKHDRGVKSQVIGKCENKHILLFEDAASTGGSIINVVKAIRDAGGKCNHCIVVIDREEGARENCEKEDIKIISLLKKSDFGLRDD